MLWRILITSSFLLSTICLALIILAGYVYVKKHPSKPTSVGLPEIQQEES